MKIKAMMVQNGERHDDILHMALPPVNMRLFHNNHTYRTMVLDIISYMVLAASLWFEDYPKAQGISGANVGIPFNIVAVVVENADTEVFLNPTITEASEEMIECKSNCGSVNLPKKIKVMRHRWVKVKYYDRDGYYKEQTFRIGDDNPVSSATLQHEIEHNLGILIVDKEV